jgi:hypothetical protein
MSKAIRDTTKIDKPLRKKRAPAPGTPIMTRLQPAELDQLDAWIAEQSDQPTRPEAVRRLLRDALTRHARRSK